MQKRPDCGTKAAIYSFPAATLAVVASLFLFDEPIALAVDRGLRSNELLMRYTDRIPDLLLPAVLLFSAGAWFAYLRRVRSGIHDDRTRFHRLVGTGLPVAFVLKGALKYVFGRIETRAWLDHPAVNDFLWFRGADGHSGFPSGHMTVFAALAAAVWIFFPTMRLYCALGLGILGLALILSNYHFLADVIAGAYLGWVVIAMTCWSLESRSG
jgi:membrane-associated phospholipid phosphatase